MEFVILLKKLNLKCIERKWMTCTQKYNHASMWIIIYEEHVKTEQNIDNSINAIETIHNPSGKSQIHE